MWIALAVRCLKEEVGLHQSDPGYVVDLQEEKVKRVLKSVSELEKGIISLETLSLIKERSDYHEGEWEHSSSSYDGEFMWEFHWNRFQALTKILEELRKLF